MKSAVQRLRSFPEQIRRWSGSRSTGEADRNPPICDDIRGWCTEHQKGEYRIITPPSRVERRPPRTLEPEVHPSFEPLYRVEIPPRALVRVGGARLVGPNGLVVLPDGSFVGELVALTPPGRRAMLAEQAGYRDPLPPTVSRKRGHYYPLFVIGWGNYHHWNHDVIMRASRVIEHLPPDTTFLVPPDLTSFHQESIKLLGIEDARLETFDGERVWEFESLFFSTPIMKTQIDVREPLEWFKTTTFRRYQIPPPRRSRRLYVTKRLDHHWQAVNEPEVEACLQAHGFETVVPGTLPFRDQAALFSEAEVIVGTGSGLSLNMVFAPEGARILQLQEPTHVVHAVWTAAESLGQRYWYVMCEARPNPVAKYANMFVPVDKLQRALDVVLSDGDTAHEGNGHG